MAGLQGPGPRATVARDGDGWTATVQVPGLTAAEAWRMVAGLRRKPVLPATEHPNVAETDVLEALELILPFAVTAPTWAIIQAKTAIKAAKGERS